MAAVVRIRYLGPNAAFIIEKTSLLGGMKIQNEQAPDGGQLRDDTKNVRQWRGETRVATLGKPEVGLTADAPDLHGPRLGTRVELAILKCIR